VAGYRAAGSDVNDEEARLIAALIAACCEHPLYKEATLGAISLLGEDQARLILERVRALVPPEELDRRAFIAGDAYHFQGDEREVMFLSLVEAPSERRPAVLNRRPDQQRFNVAASRARDQMWIVHSVDASHFHPDDMRARLLAHYAHRDDQARNWRDVSEVLRGERYYFQRLVAQQLIQRGYRVRAEVPVGQYRIDLVVDGESESLAVECDGERWHTLDTHREDVARQMTLERLGWEFFRVRGGHYFRDPERALAPLWRRFDELGITPVAGESANNNVAVADEILRRAEELLKQGADVPLGLTTESEAPATAPSVVDTPSPASRLESPVDAARVILEFLAHNPGWHGRQEIVTATGLDDEWRDAITHLLGRGLVVRRGAKRGTHYRAATPSPPPAAFSEGPQQAYGLEPGARDVPGPPRIDDEHATEDARRALIRLREGIVRPAFPDAPAERGLLRRAMLEAFLRHRPTSLTEYERRIPESLRQFTDPGQLRHLPEVFTILSRVPRP